MITSVTLLALILGYVCGSVPFGLLLTKAAGMQDIRTIGSHNIGATNVLRTGRKDLAAATLLLDGLKGTAAILIAAQWGEFAALAAALGSFFGHCFPVWLKFKGGKGVATFLGCLLGLYWPAAILFAFVWLAVARLTRYSSAAALAASLVSTLLFFALGKFAPGIVVMLLSALVYFTHRANIGRLLAGTESRIGPKS